MTDESGSMMEPEHCEHLHKRGIHTNDPSLKATAEENMVEENNEPKWTLSSLPSTYLQLSKAKLTGRLIYR